MRLGSEGDDRAPSGTRGSNLLYYGMLTAFILEYVRPGTYFPVITAAKLNAAVPLLVFALTLYAQRQNSNALILSHRNSRWLAFLLGLLILAIFHADVTLYSYNVFIMVLGYVFLYFVISKQVDDNGKLKLFVLTLVLCHVVLVYLNPDLVLHPETRSYIEGVTFLGDGNDFSLSVVLLIPLALYLYLDTRGLLAKLVLLSLVGVLLLGVIGTSSRGASIALAVVVVYLWWRGRKKVWGIVAISALVIAVAVYAPPEYFERLDRIENYEEDGSAMGRIMAWKSAIRMANDHPLLGTGTGHFPVKLGAEYRPPEYGDRNLPWLTAHSIYFLALGEMGYTGLLFLLGILYANYRSGQRIMKQVRQSSSDLARRYERLFLCLNGSLIGFAAGGAFLSALYYPHLYVISGLYVAAELMYRRDEPRILAEKSEDESKHLPEPERAF